MGAGASAESMRHSMKSVSTKPLDASDIKDFDSAINEIKFLRKLAFDLEEQLRGELKNHTGNAGVKQKREAVLDKGGKKDAEIDVTTYVPKVVDKDSSIKDLIMSVVTTNILFSSYTKNEHQALVDGFDKMEVAADTFVIHQGESGDHFYVVQQGSLEIYIKGSDGENHRVGNTLGPGNAFGELALMYNTPRAASIKAISPTVLWYIDRNTYRGILTYYKYLRNKQYMEFLRNVEIMDRKLGVVMSEHELEKMVMSLDRESFETGEAIVRQGNTGDHFYIIAEGNVGVFKTGEDGVEKKLAVLTVGNYFGEKALLKEDVRSASCIAESHVLCLTLDRDDFIDLMGTVEEMMSKEAKSPDPPAVVTETSAEVASGFALDIAISDLEVKATIGCGAFGRVKLCKHHNQVFALKCQSKCAIVESGLQEHVLNELRVMRKVDHPFIAKLYVALQDKKYIYFVLELLQGGELFTHLRNKGKLSEQSARFYAAIVVYAFSSIHAKKIAYRDLKPENLVMDSKGYVKLVDFGLAKQLLSGKTWTLCGTPDYLAPEIILNEGHDLAVDYWALGVLIFEMVVGAPPFYAEDPMEVYEKILSGNPSIPSFFTRNLSDLVKKLLRQQQSKRLGNTRGGTAAVIKHKWFSSFDWTGLENAESTAPFVPTVASVDDVSNFDNFSDGDVPADSTWNPEL